DQSPTAGGFHQSFLRSGHVFDTGCFTYLRKDGAASLPGLFPSHFAPADNVRTSVVLGGAIHPFPLPFRALWNRLGLAQKLLFVPHSVASRWYFHARLARSGTLDDWLCSRLGPWLYEASGLRVYLPKVLGIDPTQTDANFARKRLQFIEDGVRYRHVI